MPSTTVYIGIENGKPLRKFVRAKNDKELEKKVRQIKIEIENKKNVIDKCYFDAWANKWLNECAIPSGICEGTIIEYKAAIKHLNNRYENVSMRDITLSDFQVMINGLSLYNQNTGKPASKKLLNDIVKTAKKIFCYARDNNNSGIPDFFNSVVISKKASCTKRRALFEDEINRVIEMPHRAQTFAMLGLFSGLRRGEIIPLLWNDIDLNKGIIYVTRFCEFKENNPVLKNYGKSTNARRVVKIPPVLVEYLKNVKKTVDKTASLVCPNAKGTLHTKSSFRKMWDSYMRDMNVKYGFDGRNVSKFSNSKLPMVIERFTPHFLRHTFATLLYLQKIDLGTAKQLMGHEDIATTSNIYTDIQNNSFFTVSKDFKKKLKSEYRIKI